MKLITAINTKGFIGLNGELPWRSSADLKYFKEQTVGCKLLVGRTTFEKLPPLKGRELIVVGTGHYTLQEALDLKPDWIIGGASIYQQCAHLCDEWHLSIINDTTVGDVRLPEITTGTNTKIIFNYFNTNQSVKQ